MFVFLVGRFGFVWYFCCMAETIGMAGPVKKIGENFLAGPVAVGLRGNGFKLEEFQIDSD